MFGFLLCGGCGHSSCSTVFSCIRLQSDSDTSRLIVLCAFSLILLVSCVVRIDTGCCALDLVSKFVLQTS